MIYWDIYAGMARVRLQQAPSCPPVAAHQDCRVDCQQHAVQDKLGFPDKNNPRRAWTPSELNRILHNHVVRNQDGCALTTFGCVEWESELYRGVMRARCYPWKMPKHSFHRMNPQIIPSYT